MLWPSTILGNIVFFIIIIIHIFTYRTAHRLNEWFQVVKVISE